MDRDPDIAATAEDCLTLRLRRIVWEAPGVLSLDFVAPGGGELPPFGPGAHVDLHLPDGMVRQYSLCGDPADRQTYRVAVRELEGGHVSRAIHRELRPGALLSVGVPRNNFPFVASRRYLFIAGGIGITPLLSMMRQATRTGAQWSLLFCTRRPDDAPFLLKPRRSAATSHCMPPKPAPAWTSLRVSPRCRKPPSCTAAAPNG